MRLGVLAFLQRETDSLNGRLLLLTATSGIANALNLAVINGAVESMQKGGPSWYHFLWFSLSIVLFVYSLRFIMYESSRITEQAMFSVRVRLADKIRHADLLSLEAIGEADIHARISQDTAMIAQAARPLFAAAQGAVMVFCTIVYIAFISPIAMALCVLLIVGGIGAYLKDKKRYESTLRKASAQEDELFGTLSGMLKGFKEVRLNRVKSDDLFDDFRQTANRVYDLRLGVAIKFSNNIVFTEMFFLLLLGAIVFVLPVLSTAFGESVTKIVAAILFFFGPLGNVVMIIPLLSQVNVTVTNLQRLEITLDEALAKSSGRDEGPLHDYSGFQSIRFNNLGFSYPHADGGESFHVGPFNGTVRRGEILFLVGGNGSGKTTFMKLFTGLYQPERGAITVDDAIIGRSDLQSYRNLFSAIFSDFHLFDKLHGLRNAEPERVAALLRLMGVADKTSLADGAFSTTRLSTGQRKRLALVVAYLEDKPVYVFDEVAADQDPEFRSYFYETLLPELKQAGKTVLVVSHDDRYFHVADRVLKMDYGQLRDAAAPTSPTQEPHP